ncbi:hypothetical protein D7B24_007751 [Verticillium nonalfalfae]|uniref:Uncharacterized protein n=1 Tax=Verticillium nonalfalfae TaxID=1051616 RepID=A0A3M9Y6F4_9PEZI|nr:uncharacterized protein D7B24_007751 [Verticillium nonalfalfae]RNJ56083.1 hypothetical protein D7B24_007751 [Verticillium nonalfalfae]
MPPPGRQGMNLSDAQVTASNRTVNAFLGGPRPAWITPKIGHTQTQPPQPAYVGGRQPPTTSRLQGPPPSNIERDPFSRISQQKGTAAGPKNVTNSASIAVPHRRAKSFIYDSPGKSCPGSFYI